MLSDPLADMLARIKNAYLARHQRAKIPYSKIKEQIGKILVKEGYLEKLKINPAARLPDGQAGGEKLKIKQIVINLKYKDGQPAMSNFKRISKPGVRIYKKSKKIPYPPSLGVTLVSTPQGIMTGQQARKKKIGGEIICQVW